MGKLRLHWTLVVLLGWATMITGVCALFAVLSAILPDLFLDNDAEMTVLIPVALTCVIAIVLTVIRKWPSLASSHPRLCSWGLLLGPLVFLLVSRFVVWH